MLPGWGGRSNPTQVEVWLSFGCVGVLKSFFGQITLVEYIFFHHKMFENNFYFKIKYFVHGYLQNLLIIWWKHARIVYLTTRMNTANDEIVNEQKQSYGIEICLRLNSFYISIIYFNTKTLQKRITNDYYLTR